MQEKLTAGLVLGGGSYVHFGMQKQFTGLVLGGGGCVRLRVLPRLCALRVAPKVEQNCGKSISQLYTHFQFSTVENSNKIVEKVSLSHTHTFSFPQRKTYPMVIPTLSVFHYGHRQIVIDIRYIRL